jgi:hypothetical protein
LLWWTRSDWLTGRRDVRVPSDGSRRLYQGRLYASPSFVLASPPSQLYRSLSLFPTPPLLYHLVREGRAQTPFITSEHFSSLSVSPCLVYPIKSFTKFQTLFLRHSMPVRRDVNSKSVQHVSFLFLFRSKSLLLSVYESTKAHFTPLNPLTPNSQYSGRELRVHATPYQATGPILTPPSPINQSTHNLQPANS